MVPLPSTSNTTTSRLVLFLSIFSCLHTQPSSIASCTTSLHSAAPKKHSLTQSLLTYSKLEPRNLFDFM